MKTLDQIPSKAYNGLIPEDFNQMRTLIAFVFY